MIVWIASYPRSGNSVLRQILHFTMNQASYSEDVESDELWGIPEAWGRHSTYEEFHAWASTTPETVFVKTHRLPNDDNPAIYVVRDGRAAISSFLKLERHLSPDSPSNSLLHLILGDRYYSSWSEHFRVWHAREEGPILTLQYNELFAAGPDVLEEIAAFVDYTGPIAPWTNPIDEWRKRYPDFVGAGNTRWVPDDEWDFVCDHAFWELHGDLMRALDLDDKRRIEAPSDHALLVISQLLPVMKSWVDRLWTLEHDGDEKRATIEHLELIFQELRHERDLQESIAAERLVALDEAERERSVQAAAVVEHRELIEQISRDRDLHAEAAAQRLALVEELTHARDAEAEAARERLALITELEHDRDAHREAAEERLAALGALALERDRQAVAAEQRLTAIEGLDRDRNAHPERGRDGWT